MTPPRVGLTVRQLHERLAALVAAGRGDAPVHVLLDAPADVFLGWTDWLVTGAGMGEMDDEDPLGFCTLDVVAKEDRG